MPVENPLSADDLATIKQALTDAADAKALIQQASQAGIEVGEFKARTDEAEQRLLRIKQAFFPGE